LSAVLRKTNQNWAWIITSTGVGPRGIGTCAWSFWPNCFWCACGCDIKKAPALTLPQARALLEWSLPHPKSKLAYVLEFVRYHQARNRQAYLSHRKRRLKELENWKDLEMSL
jgi:hypothetical protein